MEREKILLGINGFSRRVHDPSASLVINGEVVAFAEEERFTRQKHAFGKPPHHAIAHCLASTGISLDRVDAVAIGWDFSTVYAQQGKHGPTSQELIDIFFPKQLFKYTRQPEIEMVPHHASHAASSFFTSGNEVSDILVIDGQGERQATSLFKGRGSDMTLVKEYPVSHSLGYFYEAVSEYVGLTRLDAGKTMGLASYGSSVYTFDAIRLTENGYDVTLNQPNQTDMDLQQEMTKAWLSYLEDTFGPRNQPLLDFDRTTSRFSKRTEFPKHYQNVASSAQEVLYSVVSHLLNQTRDTTHQQICIAGGVGLNCTLNGKLDHESSYIDVFVPPFTNDAGVSVGAALYLSDTSSPYRLRTASLGPEYTDDVIQHALSERGISARPLTDIAKTAATLISNGKIVGWFQGKMEAGPRALGNRSILGDPRSPGMHSRLNYIKNRENWRPLAPSMLEEHIGSYMTSSSSSPFMLKAFEALPETVNIMPSAVHIDGTSRVQTVTTEGNPLFHQLLREFYDITGVPAVMNTSFNLDDEPIVCTPQDALKTFYASGIDYLAIGNYLVEK